MDNLVYLDDIIFVVSGWQFDLWWLTFLLLLFITVTTRALRRHMSIAMPFLYKLLLETNHEWLLLESPLIQKNVTSLGHRFITFTWVNPQAWTWCMTYGASRQECRDIKISRIYQVWIYPSSNLSVWILIFSSRLVLWESSSEIVVISGRRQFFSSSFHYE